MDMDQSAVFLAGSVLTMMGLIVIAVGIVIINNVISKYWKPVRVFTSDSFSLIGTQHDQSRFMTSEEYAKIAPSLHEESRESDSKNIDLSKNK
jgi:hypothetical protein